MLIKFLLYLISFWALIAYCRVVSLWQLTDNKSCFLQIGKKSFQTTLIFLLFVLTQVLTRAYSLSAVCLTWESQVCKSHLHGSHSHGCLGSLRNWSLESLTLTFPWAADTKDLAVYLRGDELSAVTEWQLALNNPWFCPQVGVIQVLVFLHMFSLPSGQFMSHRKTSMLWLASWMQCW